MMKGHYKRQSQFELFPGNTGELEFKNDSPGFYSSFVLSIENFVVLCVIIIMSMVLSFSLGVEKGKKETVVKIAKAVASQPRVPARVKPQEPPQAQIGAAVMQAKLPDLSESIAEVLDGPKENSAGSAQQGQEPDEAAQKKTVDKIYTVQVASFQTKTYAEKEAQGLKGIGYEIFIIPKGKYSIVCVGKFSQISEARQVSSKLKAKYPDCLIRSL